MTMPSSILYPDAFNRSAPPAFDGVMDWSWMQACWANQNDKPMDFDAVKERNGEFLVVETKNIGARVPLGQTIAFQRLHAQGNWAVMLVWGKLHPEYGEFWFPNKAIKQAFTGIEQAQGLVRRWFLWADQKPRPRTTPLHEIGADK